MSLRLVLRRITSHPIRSLLTFGSVAVAVFLLCFLRSAVAALSTTVDAASSKRLWVQSAVSLYVNLPESYHQKITAVPDVESVCRFQWFGGVFQDSSSFFAQFGVDPETFLPSYPEMEIDDGTYADFAANRTGCVIGAGLAEDFGWKVGDRVPLIGTIYPRADGSPWEFTVEAIYRAKSPVIDEKTLYFHYDYLRESQESGVSLGPPGVGVYLTNVDDGGNATAVMAAVDGLFENGPQRVQSTTEAEFNRQFVSMLGNVPALLSGVGAAVLFAIFFAVLNTMLMAGRERTRDVGVLKALGFTDGAVFWSLVLESCVLCMLGGLLGIGLALASENVVVYWLAGTIQGFAVDQPTILLGLGVALLLGIVAGVVPGLRLRRLRPVVALRAEG